MEKILSIMLPFTPNDDTNKLLNLTNSSYDQRLNKYGKEEGGSNENESKD